MPRALLRPVISAAIGALAVAALAGCVPTTSPSSSATPTATATTTSSPSSTASTTPTPVPTPSATPVTVSCDALISPDAIYAFNPNFGLVPGWTPAAGSAAASATSQSGIACRWSNQTSGDTIDVSVAHLDAASIAALKSKAASQGSAVSTYGAEGYFGVKAGVGTAVVFPDGYWLVATSIDFAEAQDAAQLIQAALPALK